MEIATIRIDGADPSPRELKACFAEVFASLDENPRPIFLAVHTANDCRAAFSISIEKGEPVFEMNVDGGSPSHAASHANFRGRWLAQHPSPLAFSQAQSGTKLVLIPTTGNRIIVRRPTLIERILHRSRAMAR